MISFKLSGDFDSIEKFLKKTKNSNRTIESVLRKYGEIGVRELSSRTPVDTGETSKMWSFKIDRKEYGYSLAWFNTNIEDGIPIVILLQYGHASKNGSWVEGRDFVNQSILPVFENISNDLWKEVSE